MGNKRRGFENLCGLQCGVSNDAKKSLMVVESEENCCSALLCVGSRKDSSLLFCFDGSFPSVGMWCVGERYSFRLGEGTRTQPCVCYKIS